MSAPMALIAGQGGVPGVLADALDRAGRPFLMAEIEGFATVPVAGAGTTLRFRLERLVPFLGALVDHGVHQVVFAGSLHRPRLDPALFDPGTLALLPRILKAMQAGDDAALREVIAVFEEHGLEVVGADAVCPDLLAAPGVLGTVSPGPQDEIDAARAAGIVAALGAVDVGQGAVVARGLCLALEALPGTDAMLAHVARLRGTRDDLPGGGVFFKAPKPGQDRRIDLPALGPDTVRAAHDAGLRGIAFEAGGVLMIDRTAMLAEADRLGLFLWSRDPVPS